MPKRPPEAAIQRQYDKLDEAIAEVEASYAEPEIVLDDDFALDIPEEPVEPAEVEPAPVEPVAAEPVAPEPEVATEDEEP